MKVRPSVKKMCDKCKVIKRKGKILVFAKTLSTNSVRVNYLKNIKTQTTNLIY